MGIDFTARGSGYFRVFVNGDVISQHTTEREALERATEVEIEDPSRHVHVTHDYTVDVEANGSTPAPDDDAGDPPADDEPDEDPPVEDDVSDDEEPEPDDEPDEPNPGDDDEPDDPDDDSGSDDPDPDPDPDDDTGGVIIPPTPGGAWQSQDWNFASAAAMRAASNIEPAGDAGGRGESRPAVISQPGPWGGNQVLENHFGVTPADWQPQVATNWYFPRTETELWVQTWIRFGDDWDIGPKNPTYPPNGNVDHKTFFLWEISGGTWRRWEFKVGPGAFGGDGARTVPGGNMTAAIAGDFWTLADPPSDIYWGPPGQIFGDTHAWDGQWHNVRIHAKQGTTNGAFEMWWDGAKVLDQTGIDTKSIAPFAGITFGGNRNQGTDQPMSFFYGPARLYRNNPGW